jgi:hypothetical protein
VAVGGLGNMTTAVCPMFNVPGPEGLAIVHTGLGGSLFSGHPQVSSTYFVGWGLPGAASQPPMGGSRPGLALR